MQMNGVKNSNQNHTWLIPEGKYVTVAPFRVKISCHRDIWIKNEQRRKKEIKVKVNVLNNS